MTSSEKRIMAAIGFILICVSLLTILMPTTLWMTGAIWMLSPRYLDGWDILQLSVQWAAILGLSFTTFNLSSYLFWKARGF